MPQLSHGKNKWFRHFVSKHVKKAHIKEGDAQKHTQSVSDHFRQAPGDRDVHFKIHQEF